MIIYQKRVAKVLGNIIDNKISQIIDITIIFIAIALIIENHHITGVIVIYS